MYVFSIKGPALLTIWMCVCIAGDSLCTRNVWKKFFWFDLYKSKFKNTIQRSIDQDHLSGLKMHIYFFKLNLIIKKYILISSCFSLVQKPGWTTREQNSLPMSTDRFSWAPGFWMKFCTDPCRHLNSINPQVFKEP